VPDNRPHVDYALFYYYYFFYLCLWLKITFAFPNGWEIGDRDQGNNIIKGLKKYPAGNYNEKA